MHCYILIYHPSVQVAVRPNPITKGRHTGVDRGLSRVADGTSAGSNASEHPAAILVANSRATRITL